MELTWPAVPYVYCSVYCMCTVLYETTLPMWQFHVQRGGYCTVVATSVRSRNITTVELRPTLPTNHVRKRFIAKNVSENKRDVKVELIEVMNDVALRL